MKTIGQFWDDAIVPALVEYIRIPAKSPHFDRDWRAHGYIDDAVRLAAQWCEANALPGMQLEIGPSYRDYSGPPEWKAASEQGVGRKLLEA